eukprot:7041332-Alexandrium_andersonii.AAC.1
MPGLQLAPIRCGRPCYDGKPVSQFAWQLFPPADGMLPVATRKGRCQWTGTCPSPPMARRPKRTRVGPRTM